jgi:hypothetical protein
MPKRKYLPKLDDAKTMSDWMKKIECKQIGEFVNRSTPVEAICKFGHKCFPKWYKLRDGKGICVTCGNGSGKAKEEFQLLIENQGGKVIGEYKNNQTPIEWICKNGHKTSLIPANVKLGATCVECRGKTPEHARLFFESKVKELGGVVLGEYKNALTRVLCKCVEGHVCLPIPTKVQCGRGICTECSKYPKYSENRFIDAVRLQGGIVIGKYKGNENRVECICSKGHECNPFPRYVKRGGHVCKKCSGVCQIEASNKFQERVKKQNGTIIGYYINSYTPVECICVKLHTCFVIPDTLRNENQMCSYCSVYSPKYVQQKLETNLATFGIFSKICATKT